ncbi:MAG: N-acetylglucosamine-6-phosphate deacetylase [Acidobacteriota bacterium]|nr:N-acetylglucosamine-6-phosphate deacetylase [Acidobacteriota bacterium]
MGQQTCSGRDAIGGQAITVTFDNQIRAVAPGGEDSGLWLAPGFIDAQVNGFAGVDYNDPAAGHEAIARSLAAQFARGTTRLLPTVITAEKGAMAACLRNLAAARAGVPGGDAIEGFHVEGPHISPEDGARGAHPLAAVRPPDFDEFRRWQDACGGLVRMVTLSPEWPGAPEYIERVTAEGVVAAIGHTAADAEQIGRAVRAGATLSTHLGNGAHQMLRRHPNYLWEQLAEDRLMAGFIVDGIHVGRAFLKTALRAKGIERSFLVTDAATPAGAAPGRYLLGEQPVELTAEGRVVLAGTDRLAGSALDMAAGIANLMRLAGLTLADAVRMATVNPAAAAGIAGRTRGIAAGERADLVAFRCTPPGALEIAGVWIGGERVVP